MAKVKFIKSGMVFEVSSGTEFLELYRQQENVPLKFGCTRGDCGVCSIKVAAGQENLTKLSPKEVATLQKKGLAAGYRLACQCAINGDVTIE